MYRCLCAVCVTVCVCVCLWLAPAVITVYNGITMNTIKLQVTEDQENAIKELFHDRGWTYTKKGTIKKQKTCIKKSMHKYTEKDQAGHSNEDENEPDPSQSSQESSNDCPYCFLTPCVTSHCHPWLGNGQNPCEENSPIRKEKYSKFWKVIANLGGWNDPRYIIKKRETEEGEWVVTHRRELMPMCVLKCVRDLYPNPKGQPYMGHKWE